MLVPVVTFLSKNAPPPVGEFISLAGARTLACDQTAGTVKLNLNLRTLHNTSHSIFVERLVIVLVHARVRAPAGGIRHYLTEMDFVMLY
jgi:hypothetical protein